MKRFPGIAKMVSRASVLLVIAALVYPMCSKAEQDITADVELENMAEQLVMQRSAVEKLSTELDLLKEELKGELKTKASKKRSLELEIDRYERELEKVNKDIAKQEEKISSEEVSRDRIHNLANKHIMTLRAYIEQSLPFKKSERLAEVDKVKEMLNKDTVSLLPEKALAKLWSMIEDEFRLTRENGLYRQSITLDGKTQFVDIAKLGMVLMYFKTLDKQVGMVVKAPEGWRYRLAADRDEQKDILYLFDSLDKHIRQGYFELPNPYVGNGKATR